MHGRAAAEHELVIRAITTELAAHRLIQGRCRCGLNPRMDYYRYERHVAEQLVWLDPSLAAVGVPADQERNEQ